MQITAILAIAAVAVPVFAAPVANVAERSSTEALAARAPVDVHEILHDLGHDSPQSKAAKWLLEHGIFRRDDEVADVDDGSDEDVDTDDWTSGIAERGLWQLKVGETLFKLVKDIATMGATSAAMDEITNLAEKYGSQILRREASEDIVERGAWQAKVGKTLFKLVKDMAVMGATSAAIGEVTDLAEKYAGQVARRGDDFELVDRGLWQLKVGEVLFKLVKEIATMGATTAAMDELSNVAEKYGSQILRREASEDIVERGAWQVKVGKTLFKLAKDLAVMGATSAAIDEVTQLAEKYSKAL